MEAYNMYKIEGKIIIGICLLTLLISGCGNASDRYVKEQKEATGVFVEKKQQENIEEIMQTTEKKDDEASMTEECVREAETVSESNAQIDDKQKKETEVSQIYVQVSGAVVNPGVYQLEAGARIFQAVELAGGMTETADMDSINQAQVLSDGQMIYVYTQGEALNPETASGQQGMGQSQSDSEDGKVNLNTATAEELQTLPGIGESKADIIISYREEYGPFDSIEGLMNIPGIKEGVFSKIKEHIKVN